VDEANDGIEGIEAVEKACNAFKIQSERNEETQTATTSATTTISATASATNTISATTTATTSAATSVTTTTVTPASSSSSTLASTKQNDSVFKYKAYDVILMDSEMPRMSGPAATELLRQKGYIGIIVGVTGNVMKEQTDFFLSKGANKVLGKPLDINKLEETFKELENLNKGSNI
jgi:CheY-like chemotaxis protein